MIRLRLLLAALVSVGLLLSACGSESGTAGGNRTTTELAACDVLNGWEDLTSVQRQEQLKQCIGKTVRWPGEVSEVTSDGGRYMVTFRWSSLTGILGVGGADLNKGDVVLYQGVIEGRYEEVYSRVVKLKSGRILSDEPVRKEWELDLRASDRPTSWMITAGTAYLVGTNAGGDVTVTAADAATGAKRWEKTYSEFHNTGFCSSVGYNDQQLFLCVFDGSDHLKQPAYYLVSVERETGKFVSAEQFPWGLLSDESQEERAQRLAAEKGDGFVAQDLDSWSVEAAIGDTRIELAGGELLAHRAGDRAFLWTVKWPGSATLLGAAGDLLLISSRGSEGACSVEAHRYMW